MRLPFLIVAASSSILSAQGTEAQAKRPPEAVARYLEGALDTLRRVALRRDSVDWKALRDSLLARAAGARTTEESWPALQWALRSVDRHSFLQTPRPMPEERAANKPNDTTPQRPFRRPPVTGRLIENRYGYVLVPSIGRDRPSFVDSLQTIIREYDSAGACGWVVDLRQNPGGNMWPMLAGVGPLLGDSLIGSFVVSGEPMTPWRYVRGRAWAGSDTVPSWASRGTQPPYEMKRRYVPVALLVGKQTASSGEATLIAFLGRPNVRTFGDSTAGFASVNNGYQLPDSANMVITIGFSRDRTGRQYRLRLTPDELVAAASDSLVDAPLNRAVSWLGRQESCRR